MTIAPRWHRKLSTHPGRRAYSEAIAEAGGHCLMIIKENPATLLAAAVQRLQAARNTCSENALSVF